MLVRSPMMRTPITYPIKSARGFHYCKVLSPFRVLEWMYVDSLFENDGIKNDPSIEVDDGEIIPDDLEEDDDEIRTVFLQ